MEALAEEVVLVDSEDREIGTLEKLEAHRRGTLHRAISVFIFDGQGRLLLQKRQAGKYHAQGQWSNACCSHPRAAESPLAAAHRRLREEMGFDCEMQPLFTTVYRSDVGNGLTEHEYVHAFAGRYAGPVSPDPAEADGYQWIGYAQLERDAADAPQAYSPWLRIYLASFGALIRQSAEAPA